MNASLPERTRLELGRYGEELAVEHLSRCGLVILERNWRCRAGEVDIVAREGGTLVVCEVKTRSSDAFGHPLAAVSALKLRRMRAVAAEWLRSTGTRPSSVRFDVIGVLAIRTAAPVVEHMRGVDW